jgi:hypothetical protein
MYFDLKIYTLTDFNILYIYVFYFKILWKYEIKFFEVFERKKKPDYL